MWIFEIIVFNLAIVFASELPVGAYLGARGLKKFVSLALINVITNPPVVLGRLIMTIYFAKQEQIGILILEAVVVVAEGFMFSRFGIFAKYNPYLISLALNFISFIAGEILITFL